MKNRVIRFSSVLALLGVLGGKLVVCRPHELGCEAAVQTVPDEIAIIACQREYERTQLPATGALLANLLYQSREPVAAWALAYGLLGTEARSDALQILGQIAVAVNRCDDAERALQGARRLHLAENRHAEASRDLRALAESYAKRDRFAEALEALEECLSEARRAADARAEGECHLAATRILVRVGHFAEARKEIDLAKPKLSSDRDLARLSYEQGNLEQEAVRDPSGAPHHLQAVAFFDAALERARRSRLTDLTLAILLATAHSLTELGRVDQAERHLAEAVELDRDGAYEIARTQLSARIAYRRGAVDLASSVNERLYFRGIESSDDRIGVCVMQARLALAKSKPDLAAAVWWARRGVEEVEKIRTAQTVTELRPWVLSSRRAPYEVLFTALARSRQFEDAAVVFDRWQGRALHDTMVARTATGSQKLGRWLPVATRTLPAATGDSAFIKVVGSIDVLGFAVVEGDIWRLMTSRGQLQLEKISTPNLRDQLDRFRAAPTNRVLAGDLGKVLLPDEIFRTSNTLRLVLDARLSTLPIVALRREGRALIAVRPVVRVPRLAMVPSCVRRDGATSALVLGDASSDRPDALREADRVASVFKSTARVGAAATSTALFEARSYQVLHMAVDVRIDSSIDASAANLILNDRPVSAFEISANKLGPSLVVLAAGDTASSPDPDQAGSLAMAFLAAGSAQVVATLRSVSDAGTLVLVARFYAEGGAEDPVRALARVQAVLADSNNEDWPSFAVFGNDLCAPR